MIRPSIVEYSFDDELSVDVDDIVFVTNGQVEQYCGETGLRFSGNNGFRALELNTLNITGFSMLQFDLTFGCEVTFDTGLVDVTYGSSSERTLLTSTCTSSSCSSFAEFSTSLRARDFGAKWTRVTIPIDFDLQLPDRIIISSRDTEFALRNLYIGPECTDFCAGHGRCSSSGCVCDSGFELVDGVCRSPEPLPSSMRETFNDDLLPSLWSVVSGAVLSGRCGIFEESSALYFTEPKQRRISTVDLDLSAKSYVQYTLATPCTDTPESSEGALIAYSVDGGIRHQRLTSLSTRSAGTRPSFLKIPAQSKPIQLVWFQPLHSFSLDGDIWVR